MGKNSNGIDYKDVRAFAKVLGVNIVGKKRDKAINMVFEAIKANYEQAKAELGPADFEIYKGENQDMLSWFNANRQWKSSTDAEPEKEVEDKEPEPKPREEPAIGAEGEGKSEEDVEDKSAVTEKEEKPGAEIMGDPVTGEDEPVEGETTDKKKGSVKTKDGIKKAKAGKKDAGKVKAGKENGKGRTGSVLFVVSGLGDGSFKGKTNKEIAEIARKRCPGSAIQASGISWCKAKMRKEGTEIIV